MVNSAIADWFALKNYNAGVSLYEQFGSDSFLKILFATGDTPFNRGKLLQELWKLKEVEQPEQPAAGLTPNPSPKREGNEQPTARARYVDGTRAEHEAEPAEVRALKEEKSRLFPEMSNLHALLESMNEEERGKAAFRIQDLDKLIRAIWAKLDYYEEHKRLPEEQKIVLKDMSIAEAMVRRNTLRTYLSRDPENPKAAKWQMEFDACEKIIGG